MKKAFAVLFALAMSTSACVIEVEGEDEGPSDPGPGGGGSGGSGSGTTTYNNHVELECNGQILIDRVFTSRSDCEAHRESNSYYCGTIEMTFSC